MATHDASTPTNTITLNSPSLLDRATLTGAKCINVLLIWTSLFKFAVGTCSLVIALIPGLQVQALTWTDTLVPPVAVLCTVVITAFVASTLTARDDTPVQVTRTATGLVRSAFTHTAEWIGARRGQTGHLLAVGALAGVVALAVSVVVAQLPIPAGDPGTDQRFALAPSRWVRGVWWAVGGGISEEVFYRGFLLIVVGALATTAISMAWRRAVVAAAVLATSAVFALSHLHYSPMNAVSSGLGGLVYTYVALRYRSLLPAITAHMLFNLIAGLASSA